MEIDKFMRWLEKNVKVISTHFPVSKDIARQEFAHWVKEYSAYKKKQIIIGKEGIMPDVLYYKQQTNEGLLEIDYPPQNGSINSANELMFIFSLAYKFWAYMELELTYDSVDETQVINIDSNPPKEVSPTPKTKKPDTPILKLSWTGTPAEFGAIISTLIDRGYLGDYSTMSITAVTAIMRQVFNVKTRKGQPVKERTIQDYLGRNKKQFPVNTFKIPLSDNYDKKTGKNTA